MFKALKAPSDRKVLKELPVYKVPSALLAQLVR